MRPFAEWTRGSKKISEVKIVLERRKIILFFLLLFHNPALFGVPTLRTYSRWINMLFLSF